VKKHGDHPAGRFRAFRFFVPNAGSHRPILVLLTFETGRHFAFMSGECRKDFSHLAAVRG
jgi:hypothetical protein